MHSIHLEAPWVHRAMALKRRADELVTKLSAQVGALLPADKDGVDRAFFGEQVRFIFKDIASSSKAKQAKLGAILLSPEHFEEYANQLWEIHQAGAHRPTSKRQKRATSEAVTAGGLLLHSTAAFEATAAAVPAKDFAPLFMAPGATRNTLACFLDVAESGGTGTAEGGALRGFLALARPFGAAGNCTHRITSLAHTWEG